MSELLGITGRSVLITGAGGPNMGQAAAQLFATHGARVVVSDVNAAGLEDTVARVRSTGAEILARTANVLDEASVVELIDYVRATCGSVDHVLNFAAAYEPRHGTMDCDSADWDRIVGVTLKGTWLVSKHAMRAMRDNAQIGDKAWRGAIITIASAVGHRGGGGFVAYAAAKAGILGLTRAMAADGAPLGVRVNCISPGLTRTPATPLEEGSEAEHQAAASLHLLPYICEPLDQAQAALWLCSDAARCVTGATLNVDGGWTAK